MCVHARLREKGERENGVCVFLMCVCVCVCVCAEFRVWARGSRCGACRLC